MGIGHLYWPLSVGYWNIGKQHIQNNFWELASWDPILFSISANNIHVFYHVNLAALVLDSEYYDHGPCEYQAPAALKACNSQ